jgi:hypothetical protein
MLRYLFRFACLAFVLLAPLDAARALDPATTGIAAMSVTAPEVKVGRIGWFAPSGDPTTPTFASLVAPRLPTAVRLDRIDVTSDHMGAPQAAAAAIVTWLKALPEQ